MSTLGKVGVVLLNLVVAAVLFAAIADPELRIPGLVFVAAALVIWERTRE